jgi:hypothetical protein
MDALRHVRMVDVLAEIPVDDEIKKALLGRPSRCRPVFEVVLDYESGTLGAVDALPASHRFARRVCAFVSAFCALGNGGTRRCAGAGLKIVAIRAVLEIIPRLNETHGLLQERRNKWPFEAGLPGYPSGIRRYFWLPANASAILLGGLAPPSSQW